MEQNKRRVFTPRAKFSFKSQLACLNAKEVLEENYPHLMTSISVDSFPCYLFVQSSSRRDLRTSVETSIDKEILKTMENVGGEYLGIIT